MPLIHFVLRFVWFLSTELHPQGQQKMQLRGRVRNSTLWMHTYALIKSRERLLVALYMGDVKKRRHFQLMRAMNWIVFCGRAALLEYFCFFARTQFCFRF